MCCGPPEAVAVVNDGSSMKESPVKVGEVLAGKYRVDSILGVGGMGVVVEATHLELQEPRAIKLMLPEALEEKEAVERFMREARASSRLKSEYVARVHDVGKLDNGSPYMVMEQLHGSDLRHVIKERGRLPAPEAIHYALQACEALAEAHSIGIIHRDLKPANLFLTQRTDGTPCIKVLDFGISKVLGSADLEMTKTQAVLGSPSYMSPEQMRSARNVDARTDIWSLGVILYRLITGELPFRAESITELVTKVLQNAPRPPSTIVPDVPRELDDVLLRCFERDLSRRYANVGELSAALLPFAPSEARASIERIARVLAVASHGRGALPPPGVVVDLGPSSKASFPARSSSGDAWANTSFGAGTIAVHRWKLWALGAAFAVMSIAFGVSILVSRHAHPEAVSPSIDDTSAAPLPRPAAVAMGETPKPQPATLGAPPVPVPSPQAPAAEPPPATAPPVAPPVTVVAGRGPLPTARPLEAHPPRLAKTAEPAPVPPPPAPSPPVASTAPHRMFGSDN